LDGDETMPSGSHVEKISTSIEKVVIQARNQERLMSRAVDSPDKRQRLRFDDSP
jgi:hypothetical protein